MISIGFSMISIVACGLDGIGAVLFSNLARAGRWCFSCRSMNVLPEPGLAHGGWIVQDDVLCALLADEDPGHCFATGRLFVS